MNAIGMSTNAAQIKISQSVKQIRIFDERENKSNKIFEDQ